MKETLSLREQQERRIRIVDLYGKYGVIFIFLIVFISCSLLSPVFLKWSNLSSVLNQAAITMVLTCGMTMVIISGNADLSAGSTVAVCAVMCALIIKSTGSIALAITAAFVVGMLGGLVNGVCISAFSLPAFIVTLATQMILRGVAYIISGGVPIHGVGKLIELGQGKMLGVPNLVWVALAVILLTLLILNKSMYGRYLYAIGGNREAASASGINVKLNTTLVFVIMGVVSALGGVMLAARTNSGQPGSAEGYEFDAIIAAVLGGTSMSGGVGGIIGSVFGAMTIAVINNGMNLVGVSPYFQKIVKGVIILIAIFIDKKTRDIVMKK